jgi:Flp pilus assembly protein TadG
MMHIEVHTTIDFTSYLQKRNLIDCTAADAADAAAAALDSRILVFRPNLK